MILSWIAPSWVEVVGVLIGVLAVRRVYYEFTTGAARRSFIKEHNCEPIYQRPQKGLWGRLLGLDIILMQIQDDKDKRTSQAAWERHFQDRNTVKMRVMGMDVIQTTEPENFKTVLSLKFHDYAISERRIRAMLPVLGKGIFVSEGIAWEHSRAMLRPSFTRTQVADPDGFEKHVQNLISILPRDGSTVNLQPLFALLTMDSATEFLFGRSTSCLAPDSEKGSASEVAKAYDYCNEFIFRSVRSNGLTDWVPNRTWYQQRDVLHGFADSVIQDAIARQDGKDCTKSQTEPDSQRYVFLEELLKQTQDRYTLRSECLNLLLAGRDTTSALLTNIIYQLARRPDVWSKLRTEAEILHGERPGYAELKDMKYVRWVVNESLRLLPVVPANARTAVRDTVLPLGGGPNGTAPAFVSKGSLLVYHPYSTHRRKDYYGEDADDFKPERWEKLRPGWEYLPFNGGPRICLGQQFALFEASYTLVRLVQAFPRIEARGEREWCEMSALILSSGTGCNVALFDS